MELTGQKTALSDLSLSDLRQLGRDKIEELVATGLLEADRAAEIQSEDFQHKQDEQQFDTRQRSQAQSQRDEQKKDDDWLQHMSQSYQQSYHELMDTYDAAEKDYGKIKSRAEELKDSLAQKVETARQYGVPLSDGEQAFLDKQNNSFVNGALQPLNAKDSKEATDDFKLLTPQQQQANACYVDACRAYGDAADISQTADTENLNIQNDKQKLDNSQGSISEQELSKDRENIITKKQDISARLDNLQGANANLDAALSAGGDDAGVPQNSASQTTSFASQIDTNAKIIGDGNGKTSAAFNAAVNAAPEADVAVANNAPAPVKRLPLTPAS